jgi:hypothetical protein
MIELRDQDIGTRDLEQGMRASPAMGFVTIATIAMVLLAVFNPAGLENGIRRLPPGALTSGLVAAASGWRQSMERLGPAKLFDDIRRMARNIAP